jgi:hypothetical protein
LLDTGPPRSFPRVVVAKRAVSESKIIAIRRITDGTLHL